jgi:two-component system sensor histidine kinase SenX3
VDLWLAIVVGLAAGLAVGWVIGRTPRQKVVEPDAHGLPLDVMTFVEALPELVIVVGGDDVVQYASSGTAALGLIRAGVVTHEAVAPMIRHARDTGTIDDDVIEQRRPAPGRGMVSLAVRVAPLRDGAVLVTVRDLSAASRLESVRRDFVANVSHELKTPVGALTLLAEAVEQAADDPDAVRHFAGRMQHESARLGNLVRDLIDLSRLQSDDPLSHAAPVDVDGMVEQAIEAVRTAADARNITLVDSGTPHLVVEGDESQLVTALRNLLANAVTYSPEHTQVTVTTLLSGDAIEIAVRDQGIGIPQAEQDRIFERFYRIDPARSRVTGGTGLGLAIVKHVCANHGGQVTLWSVPTEGSTFTLKLPATQDSTMLPGRTAPARATVASTVREGVS